MTADLLPCPSEGQMRSGGRLPAHVASATETEAQHSAGQQEHLRLAINGVKAALPVLYMLLDNEHNVDAWGILARIAALEAARDFAPQGVSPLSSEPGAGGGIEGASGAESARTGTLPVLTDGPCQSEVKHADDCQIHIVDVRGRPDDCTCGAAEAKANHDCLAKRRPGEPMFILLGRDPDAHNIVRLWAERRLAAGGDPEHCQMGLDTSERMKLYASDPANAPASAPPATAYAALSSGEPTPAVAAAKQGASVLSAPDEPILSAIRPDGSAVPAEAGLGRSHD